MGLSVPLRDYDGLCIGYGLKISHCATVAFVVKSSIMHVKRNSRSKS